MTVLTDEQQNTFVGRGGCSCASTDTQVMA